MTFHRLATPTYYLPSWPPSGYDYINNTPGGGSQAPADGAKTGGTYTGTYFIDFGEDAYSQFGNRAHSALAENTDFLDDVVSGPLPVVTHYDATTVGSTAQVTMTGLAVFVGESGTPATAASAQRLISVVDPTTNNELVDAAGNRIYVSDILDSTATTSQIGNDFYVSPVVQLSTAIPATTSYRLVYGKRSNYKSVTSGASPLLSGLFLEAVRGAHLVPAEVVRFLMEAVRRSAGSVQSLQSVLYETPTTGNPLLGGGQNLMTMHVDANADVANSGEFLVTFGGTKKYLRVLEETATLDSNWRSDDVIRFSDSNTDSLGTPEPIPLTGSTATNGDEYPRVADMDPTVASVNVPSIFQCINGRWTVTVGDGSSTFGDFNGATAVADAINAYNAGAGGYGDLHIRIKPGTYSSPHAATLHASLDTLTLEGVGENCIVQLSSTWTISGGKTLKLRNLTVSNSGAAAVAISVITGIHIVDSTLTDVSVKHAPTGSSFNDAVKVYRSTLTNQYAPAFILAPAGAYTTRGYLFKDCKIVMEDEFAAFKYDVPGVFQSTVGRILFDSCRILLFGTSVSGGNPNAIVGVMEAEKSTGAPIIEDVTWKDCIVEANHDGTQTCSILMYHRGGQATGSVTINKLTIQGGRWSCPAQDTALIPFYLGGDTETLSVTYGPDNVVIRDVDWGFEEGTSGYGTATPYGVASTEVASSDYAFIIAPSNSVEMRDVRWISNLGYSAAGDLLIYKPKKGYVRGLVLDNFQTYAGGTAPPTYRFKYESLASFITRISDCMINATGSTGQTTVSSGLYCFTNPSPGRNFVVSGCTACNADFGGGTESGFVLPTGSVRLEGCNVYNVTGSGIRCYFATDVSYIHVVGCRLTDIGDVGLLVRSQTSGSNTCDGFFAASNFIYSCANQGIFYSPGTVTSVMSGGGMETVNITGNTVLDCALASIQLGESSRSMTALPGIVYGNVCTKDNSLAQLKMYTLLAGGPTLIHGVETAYATPYDFASIVHASGDETLHNRALLTLTAS